MFRFLLAVVIGSMLPGCGNLMLGRGNSAEKGTVQADEFQPLTLVPENNLPVLWMRRNVLVRGADDRVTVHHGLFACYRSDTPAAPKCFLAQVVADERDIKWPTDAVLGQ